MRIIQLANFHGPLSGGIRTTLKAWRAGYRAAGHEVHLVVPAERSSTEGHASGATHELAAPLIPGSGGYRMIVRWRAVRRLLAELSPDVVEVSDRTTLVGAGQWAQRRGARSVMVLHERLDNQVGAMLPGWVPHRGLVDWWNQRTRVGFDHLVATSHYGAREMARLDTPGLVTVPLGVDLEVFRPGGTRSETGPTRLLFLGRLSQDKRPDLAIETLRVLLGWGHEAELVFVGEGPLKEALRRRGRGLPVTFTGFVADRTEVASALSQADVSIVPCPGECFGLAALESMACGSPVVVAANSGAAELVRAGGGLAVPPGPRGFARAVEEIMATAERTRRAEAREVASQYPWSRSVATMLHLYVRKAVAA